MKIPTMALIFAIQISALDLSVRQSARDAAVPPC
jgi:hypothetical protein